MTVNHILTDLQFSKDFKVREEALESLTRRITEVSITTRQALAPFAVNADPHQDAVIRSSANTIRLVAPAGAGKTQTIINRVLYRVQNGLKPARTLLLTFDNAAVNSIKLKLHDKLTELGTELSGLRIMTLNAYGYSILREYFRQEYRPIIESKQQYAVAKELRDQLNKRSTEHFGALPEYLASRFYVDFFSFLKNSLFDPRVLDTQAITDFLMECPQAEVFFTNSSKHAVTKAIQAIIWLYQGYERLLQQNRLIDFDDQKLRPYILLNQNPTILETLQSQLDEVIVDEFQDINRLDFVLVEVIVKKAGLVVTGDDDQAIYGFRGCTPEFIIDLEKHFGRPAESHELEINYRCPPVIVEHADRLIRHNRRRIPKNPRAASDAVAQIHVISSLSAGLEAASIMKLIQRVRTSDSTLGYSNFVVLYRTNAQSLPLQLEFIREGIPYFVRQQDNILKNQSLEKLLCILRVKLAVNAGKAPSLHDAVQTVCSFFYRTDPKTADGLQAIFREGGRFMDTIRTEKVYNLLPAKGRDLLPQAMFALLTAHSLIQTLDEVAESFRGVYGMIGSLEEVVEERLALGEIFEIAAGFQGGVREFVQKLEIALNQARATNAGNDHKSGVPLLTYFRSKGLQWHTVILTTCNEGLIPHQKAQVEEERRLFYVAMTRASSNLVISYVENVCGCRVPPSRFLYEAGLIEKPGRRTRIGLSVPSVNGYVALAKSRVFHRPECGAVRDMGDRLTKFAMREEAVQTGRKPCGQCKP